jgi:putative copper export protein
VELTRLFLHVTAATIWVGGQLVLAVLVPTLRQVSPEVPAIAARAYARVAWPAFGVLVATGAWNAWAVRDELHGSHAVVFGFKLLAVLLSGLTAWLHARATQRRWRAVLGAATGTTALLALLLGVELAT